MTYSAVDQTTHDGEPIHLLKFTYQETIWRFTTGDEDFYDGIETWLASEIEPLGDLNVSDNLDRSPIQIVTKLTNPVAQLFRTSALESSVSLLVYEVHVEDAELSLLHTGRVLGRHVKMKGKKRTATLKSEPLITGQKRPAIRETTGKICPYVLYDASTCKATKNPIIGTIASFSGNSLVVTGADAVADGQLISGYIETTEEKRMITSHTGTSITVTTTMQGLEVGDSVNMYIGCDHSTQDCIDKHSNIENFGGEPFIPSKNPHDGRIV